MNDVHVIQNGIIEIHFLKEVFTESADKHQKPSIWGFQIKFFKLKYLNSQLVFLQKIKINIMWQNSNPLKTNLKKESDLGFFMQNIGNESRQEPKILKKNF